MAGSSGIYTIKVCVPKASTQTAEATVKANVTSNLTALGLTGGTVESVHRKEFTDNPVTTYDKSENY